MCFIMESKSVTLTFEFDCINHFPSPNNPCFVRAKNKTKTTINIDKERDVKVSNCNKKLNSMRNVWLITI